MTTITHPEAPVSEKNLKMRSKESDLADTTLKRLEIAKGSWVDYGGDGRMTTDADSVSPTDRNAYAAGEGYRARFIDNIHGDDYGWGPLGSTKAEAVALCLAEYITLTAEEAE